MNRKGFAPVFIIVIVAIAAVLGGWYYLKKSSAPASSNIMEPQSQPAISSGTTQIDASNWKVFHNDKYGFGFQYPPDWRASTTITSDDEEVLLSLDNGVAQSAVYYYPRANPQISITYTKVDNTMRTSYTGQGVKSIKIDRYDGSLYAATSTKSSKSSSAAIEEIHTEEIHAYVMRGRSAMDFGFFRTTTSTQPLPVESDKALFEKILSTVKFNSSVNGSTDATAQNSDKEKIKAFNYLMDDIKFYSDFNKKLPDTLNDAKSIITTPSTDPSIGQLIMSLLDSFSYSVSPDHKSYHLGISLQTTLIVDDGSDTDFNSQVAGWVNGFDGADNKKCKSSDTGVWCYDRMFSRWDAAQNGGVNPPASVQNTPSISSISGSSPDSRDTQRLTDLKQVQKYLTYYHFRCNYYPGIAITSSVCSPDHTQISSWKSMTQSLLGSGLFVSSVPQDPTQGATYYYGTNTQGDHYIIATKLENPSRFTSSYIPPSLIGITANGLTSCALPFYCLTL